MKTHFRQGWTASLAQGAMVLLLLLLAAAPARAADLRLDGNSGPYVEALINGVPLRLRVDLDHSRTIALNPGAAARAGLADGQGRWLEIIGPVRLRGRFARPAIAIAGRPVRASVYWLAEDVAPDADGVVTPHLLPFDSVTIERRPAGSAEQEMAFSSRIDDNHGIHVPVRIGKRRIAVRLSLSRPRTVAPTAAAAVIAREQGGILEEGKRLEEIAFGVKRPARPLQLARTLHIGDLAVTRLMARTSDFRGKHKLTEPAERAREGEILVTGRLPSQDPLYRMTLGLDVLERCSSATYVRATGELRLRCTVG